MLNNIVTSFSLKDGTYVKKSGDYSLGNIYLCEKADVCKKAVNYMAKMLMMRWINNQILSYSLVNTTEIYSGVKAVCQNSLKFLLKTCSGNAELKTAVLRFDWLKSSYMLLYWFRPSSIDPPPPSPSISKDTWPLVYS